MSKSKHTTPALPAMVDVLPVGCTTCHSTRYEVLRINSEHCIPGLAPNGHPRTHIVARRVRCIDCGQIYVRICHENRPQDVPADPEQPKPSDRASTEKPATRPARRRVPATPATPERTASPAAAGPPEIVGL